jgi:hypothetical protein
MLMISLKIKTCIKVFEQGRQHCFIKTFTATAKQYESKLCYETVLMVHKLMCSSMHYLTNAAIYHTQKKSIWLFIISP